MSGFIPSFLNGSKVSIRIGEKVVAYAQNVSISDDMQVNPVGQIGSYNTQALEPTGYLARGSLTITHYSNIVLQKLKEADPNLNNAPANIRQTDTSATAAQDGNSLLIRDFFSPANLLLSRTVNIDFYERKADSFNTSGAEAGKLNIKDFGSETNPPILTPIYRMENARFTNYSTSFSPGSLVQETFAFIGTGLLDSRAGEISKQE